jgi:UPF0271 protein
MKFVDLNCDMGEGMPNDAELMDYVSSVNVACGYHAGGPDTMRRTIELAREKGLAIGAHPGYADKKNFGRVAMQLPLDDVESIVIDQVLTLRDICAEFDAEISHVKPHGALYNQAANDRELAGAIARAIKNVDPSLVFLGLAGSVMIDEGKRVGLRTASEVFADRTYQNDGTLTPRTQPNALIGSAAESLDQVMQMIRFGTVTSTDGHTVPVIAETICIHGDGPHAVEFARAVRRTLEENQITVRPI